MNTQRRRKCARYEKAWDKLAEEKCQLLFILFLVLFRGITFIVFKGLDLCLDFGFTLFKSEASC